MLERPETCPREDCDPILQIGTPGEDDAWSCFGCNHIARACHENGPQFETFEDGPIAKAIAERYGSR